MAYRQHGLRVKTIRIRLSSRAYREPAWEKGLFQSSGWVILRWIAGRRPHHSRGYAGHADAGGPRRLRLGWPEPAIMRLTDILLVFPVHPAEHRHRGGPRPGPAPRDDRRRHRGLHHLHAPRALPSWSRATCCFSSSRSRPRILRRPSWSASPASIRRRAYVIAWYSCSSRSKRW